MMRAAPKLLLALTLTGLLGLLYVRSSSVDAKQHLHISSQLRQLHQLDEALGQYVLEARVGMLKNYDPLVQTQLHIAQLIADLKAEHLEFFGQADAKLSLSLDEYIQSNAEKVELIERFKSQNSVFKNSARYFPLAVQQLLEGAGHLRDGDPLEVEVRDKLLRDILVYQVAPSDTLLHASLESRAKIAQRMASYPPQQRKQLQSLIVHTAILVAYQEELERTLDKLFHIPTAARLDHVFELYNAGFEQAEHEADLYRFWLLLFAFSAVVYGAYSLLRVTRARADAMRALAELEFQKFALDQHSIVSITDRRGAITYINQRFTDISQYECDEILGQNHRVLNSGCHSPEFFRQMWQTISSGQVWHGEICNRRKDGRLYWVDSSIVPFMDKQGKPLRFVSIRTDITARKEAEAVMQAAKEAAEEASRAKSDFLANMSHEIRTPMNGIIGMTELALDTELNSEQREYLGLVQSSAAALLTIINDILDFSKIEAGKMDIEQIDFALPEMLAQTMASIAPRAHQKGLELLLDIAPDVPVWVAGDPGRLRQIILNLLGNALKFTDSGEIALRVTASDAVADAQSLRLCMSVSDTGIGIPPDKLQTIFESFSQADATTTRKYGGTGLGLTISTRLAELMQGHIRVESEVGKGSTFHVELVLLHSSQLAQPAAHCSMLQGVRVLLVDDYAASRAITCAILQRWQMRVTAVGDAAGAQAELQAALQAGDAYRVLLADAQLPGDDDGYELVARARALQGDALSPLLLLAASGQRGEVTRCSECAIPYLYKPYTAATLCDALLAALGVHTAPAVTPHKTLRGNRQQLHILLAEDNQLNQTLATRLLEKFGHRVTVAGNGLIAVERWRDGSYDVILMDVDMPELNGYGATAQIRALEQDRATHIPIIGLTAHAMQGSREQCLAAGMDGYLSKPIDTKALWAELEGLSVALLCPDEAAATLPTQTATLGFELRRALQLMDNDKALFDEMVRIYRADYPAYMERLAVAIAADDAGQIRQLAHTLRGMLSVFDVPEVAMLAEYIETQPGMDYSQHYASLAQALSGLEQILTDCMNDVQPQHEITTH